MRQFKSFSVTEFLGERWDFAWDTYALSCTGRGADTLSMIK